MMALSTRIKNGDIPAKTLHSVSPPRTSLFDRLPNEIIDRIITIELGIQHDGSVPNLLLALGSQKDSHWYDWARRKYHAINANITFRNQEVFNKRTFNDLLKILHIKLVSPLKFDAQKMTIRNNLETITVDITNISHHCLAGAGHIEFQYNHGEIFSNHLTIICWLVRASTAAHKVVLKARKFQRHLEVEMMNGCLGVNAREEMVAGEKDYQLFIWESTRLLRWNVT